MMPSEKKRRNWKRASAAGLGAAVLGLAGCYAPANPGPSNSSSNQSSNSSSNSSR